MYEPFGARFVSHFWDFLSVKNTIQEYYRGNSIAVSGPLKDDIKNSSENALRYIYYAIKNLLGTKGVEALLEDIAQIEKTGNQGKRIYLNSLVELHAIHFVHNSLKLTILEVESKTNKVLSPNRKGDKSCDIKAKNSVRDYYFEAKDASSEITTSHEVEGHIDYTPMLGEKITKWIVRKSKEADQKGANYLVCRVPVWVFDANETQKEFYNEWIRRIFRIKKKISENAFAIVKPIQLSSSFEGIYIIKWFGYMKLQF